MTSKTKVYAGNLSKKAHEDDVGHLFERYGPIRKLEMKLGYAFIDYEDVRDADDAVEKLDGYSFMGTRLTVEISKGPRVHGVSSGPPPNRSGGFRAICENVPPSSSWQDMKDFARKSGNVTYADVWTDSASGKKMGVIEFATKSEMWRAIKELDRRVLKDFEVLVYEEGDQGRGQERRPARSPPRRQRSPPRRDEMRRDEHRREEAPLRERSPPPQRQHLRERLVAERKAREDAGEEREMDTRSGPQTVLDDDPIDDNLSLTPSPSS
ncbi:hypothetical protein CYMTET_29818 [Cymbomonas tetramitiformis]|uniref:RRM domain-containing protein n=1 Tax=Cymbomonas tetramitiformis TaxID=36881 RepID=A0AAE0FKN4_9CHLO|nr:hypothetical protein CYMTET_29818 [Cymbomonas tetramitiformis]